MYKYSMTLHNCDGQRKYLNQEERMRFLGVTKTQSVEIRLFCQLLFYTGARIREIHNLTVQSIDLSNKTVIIECLKKRQKGIFREIPLPDHLLKDVSRYCQRRGLDKVELLWHFSLRTASRQIKKLMKTANIEGVRSSAKGLRHGFAVYAVTKAPLTMVKKWLGHSALETTEIYLNIVGAEEREFARRVWTKSNSSSYH